MTVKEYRKQREQQLITQLTPLLNVDVVDNNVINQIRTTLAEYDGKEARDIMYKLCDDNRKFPWMDKFIKKFISDIEEHSVIKPIKILVNRGGYGQVEYNVFATGKKGSAKWPKTISDEHIQEKLRLFTYCNAYHSEEKCSADKYVEIIGHYHLPPVTTFITYGSRLTTVEDFFNMFDIAEGTKLTQRNYNYYVDELITDDNEIPADLIRRFCELTGSKYIG